MRAVRRMTDRLLRRLEAARHRRPGAGETERLLRSLGPRECADAEGLIRFHEALLFLRAYPHSERVLQLSERLLGSIERRVAKLEAAGADLSAFDEPEVAGVAGTTIGTDFSFDLALSLLSRHARSLRIDWGAGVAADRMRATWPRFLPLLEEEALADANVPYLDWLAAAAGRRKDDAGWLLARYAGLPIPPADRAEGYDSLGVPLSWDLGHSPLSRTRLRRPGPPLFFHDAPFLARRDVSLDEIFAGPPMKLRRLSRREGERVCDVVRDTTAARYREFYTFTYADPASVVASRPGRGVELFLMGVTRDRRLPLRSAYGGYVIKNGVPIGYIEGLAFAERLEIGFNMYYTFREGESAWIYAQVLKLHHDALGVTSISIDPYQLGYRNHEAIASGAFWFYRKLGFRPTDSGIRRLVEEEEKRIAANPSYRSSVRKLERLVTHNVLYEAPGSPRGEWDRFHIRNLGLAVNRRMAREFGGDAAKIRAASERRVARVLGLGASSLSEAERRFFRSLAPVLDLVPDLPRWSRDEKDGVVGIIRAKAAPLEAGYLRRLRRHARLRRALIRLGSIPSPPAGGRGSG
jgi:hypothetical protein